MTKREKVLVGIIGLLVLVVAITSDRIVANNDGNIASIGIVYNVLD